MVQILPIRETPRLARIVHIAIAHGWGHYTQRFGLGAARAEFDRSPESKSEASEASHFREALEELGPVYVKFGQLLATRRERFSPAWIAELEQLQSRAAPFPGEDARRIVEAELGEPVDRLFRRFETGPMAAASTTR